MTPPADRIRTGRQSRTPRHRRDRLRSALQLDQHIGNFGDGRLVKQKRGIFRPRLLAGLQDGNGGNLAPPSTFTYEIRIDTCSRLDLTKPSGDSVISVGVTALARPNNPCPCELPHAAVPTHGAALKRYPVRSPAASVRIGS